MGKEFCSLKKMFVNTVNNVDAIKHSVNVFLIHRHIEKRHCPYLLNSLIANGARYLQRMFNMLKTKVMKFSPRGHKMSGFMLKCGEGNIEVIEKSKYLGLWFTDKLDLNYMAEQVTASGK